MPDGRSGGGVSPGGRENSLPGKNYYVVVTERRRFRPWKQLEYNRRAAGEAVYG
jgi:hypothetical protein